MNGAVYLVNPKFPHNVGGALRACAVFDLPLLVWSGNRVPPVDAWPEGARLPREERIKAYQKVTMIGGWKDEQMLNAIDELSEDGPRNFTPVAVEVSDNAESLVDFVHPDLPFYVFGPEDGGIPKGLRTVCHRFVTIPTDGCMNLAAAINVVLYDRLAKQSKTTDIKKLSDLLHEFESIRIFSE